MTKKLKKIFFIAAIALNCLLLLFCLLACFSPFLNPGNYAFIALLGIGFPFLFTAVLLTGIYMAYKKYKLVWIHILVLVLGFYQLTHCFGFNAFAGFANEKKETSLRILSWNLSSWGVTKRNNANKISYRKEMTDLMVNSNADIICMQEYHFLREKTIRDSIIPELKEKGFNYFLFARSKYTMHLFKSAHVTGVAIASKYPFADTAVFNYNDGDFAEPLVYADVLFNNKTIRIFTTHLQSVRLENYDYEALHNLKEPANASVTQAHAVAWKLKQAYKKRAQQANLLQQHITQSPHPVIVCGDFNDVPGSYVYTTAKGNLQDAFLKKGFGFGRTYRFISPTLRIDYILADKKFKVEQYKKIEVKYSDHYPVVADVKFEE
jgi:endonuclease/exonuclease/phosphatase family metal-dependent hydrolase